MKEVALEGLSKHVEEGTIQSWLVEEGDPVHLGDDLVEISTEEGTIMVTAPVSGILAEVYYDEGEVVGRGEVICTVDDDDEKIENEESDDEDDDEEDEEEDEDEDDDEDEEEDEDDEDDDEDEE